ncbi:DUF1501 domain-containing protein [Paucibacter sp. KBW04]|uniref:DUF1501 domain-containing protein n=1 Tax=Paucibacter sp. KBW04 TaxID=2153361 RepID=UPI000F572F3B|nr:DUF1501 domain-containing protein [Paucibacter sp. KBW04]RQO57228.1 DUF1501 domain-containing protein [Paucibacter sp. KBW04]
MRRRTLLAASLGLNLGATGRLLAAGASASAPKFLLVFLRGGYDAASLLVPHASSFYYEVRKDIAIAPPSSELTSALPLNGDWGLHPALRESLYPLYQRGELAFVPFAGTDDLSRSHFETQDSMELGQPSSGRKDYGSGFLNRLAGQLSGSSPMAFTDQLPKIFQGSEKVPNTALKSLAKPAIDTRQSEIIAAMYRGTPLAATVQEGFALRQELMRDLAGEMQAASRQAISAKGFELEARRIAKLMRENFNLGFVDVGGWDTHVGQGGATGYLANRFDELGQGLAGFAQEMGPAWKNTTVVVLSEFGRTFRQNGNRGTDHGHGTVMWVLGGGMRGQRVAGEQVAVERATLFQDRDLSVLNDYRAVLGGLFQRQYGLSAAQLSQVFPGAKARDLGLL